MSLPRLAGSGTHPDLCGALLCASSWRLWPRAPAAPSRVGASAVQPRCGPVPCVIPAETSYAHRRALLCMAGLTEPLARTKKGQCKCSALSRPREAGGRLTPRALASSHLGISSALPSPVRPAFDTNSKFSILLSRNKAVRVFGCSLRGGVGGSVSLP